MARFIINYIAQIIARLIVLKSIMVVTGGVPGGILGKVLGFDAGGYTGDGNKKDPAGIVHKGEFVINKEKTSIFRPLLEIINYAPINNIKSLLNGIKIPNMALPPIPKIAYDTGGYVTDARFNSNLLSEKLDLLADRMLSVENAIQNKEYNINLHTKFKGVEFAKEMDKAYAEVNRRKS